MSAHALQRLCPIVVVNYCFELIVVVLFWRWLLRFSCSSCLGSVTVGRISDVRRFKNGLLLLWTVGAKSDLADLRGLRTQRAGDELSEDIAAHTLIVLGITAFILSYCWFYSQRARTLRLTGFGA